MSGGTSITIVPAKSKRLIKPRHPMGASQKKGIRRYRFHRTIQVRFRDLDAMGHVNHAVYFSYLEQARTQYWMSLLKLRRPEDLGIIVVHAECDYHSPAQYGEWLDVFVGIREIRTTSFVMEYEVRSRNPRRRVVRGSTIQVLYDYARERVQTISPSLRTKIEMFEKRRFN